MQNRRHTTVAVLLLLTMITPCLTWAQKKELSQARSYVKSKKDYDKAEKLMVGLLKDSANRDDKRIYLVWYDAVRGQYDQANERMYLKQKQDTAQFFALCRRMFTVLESLDSVDMRPDKKGRVRPEYRERHATMLDPYRKNLFGAGSYHLKRGENQLSYDYFEQYIDCARQPLFAQFRYDSTDVRLNEAAYWATTAAYRMQDGERALRYHQMALCDTAKQQFTLQYVAEAYRWLNDSDRYIATLEQGFHRFPTAAYFFPRLYDAYTQKGTLDKALRLSDEGLAVDSLNQLFLFAKSTTLLRQERYGESVKVSKRLLELNDSLSEAYFNAGSAYLNIALKLDAQKDKKLLRTIYQQAREYLETYRKRMPDEVQKWGMPLYRIYLNLNMGRQFDEIDRLLKNQK